MKELSDIKVATEKSGTICNHTLKETQRAIALMLPYIDLSLTSIFLVFAKIFRLNIPVYDLLRSEIWSDLSVKSDSFSARLKQSSLLCMLGYNSDSLNILLGLDFEITNQLVSLCSGCLDEIDTVSRQQKLVQYKFDSEEDLLKKFVIPCVHYHPTERALTPPPLVYEVVTSLTAKSIDKFPIHSQLASVDGKILYNFLLYLNHTALGMAIKATANIEYIHWLVERDEFLRHREVALNILGWIYKKQGRVDEAFRCFRSSLDFRFERNAAIFYMLDILHMLMNVIYSDVSHEQ